MCDRRIKLKIKYVVRPAIVYRTEAWAVEMANEKELDVTEIRMLRRSNEVGQNRERNN